MHRCEAIKLIELRDKYKELKERSVKSVYDDTPAGHAKLAVDTASKVIFKEIHDELESFILDLISDMG